MTTTTTPQTETASQQVEAQTDRLAIALDLLCDGVELEPRKIAEILTLQAAAIAGDLECEDARELYEDLSSIAARLNTTDYEAF